MPLDLVIANRIATQLLDAETVGRLSGARTERARVLRLLQFMVYNPDVFTPEQLAAIERVRHDLIDRICDPNEGTNPFPDGEALLLVDPGGPWEPARFTPATRPPP